MTILLMIRNAVGGALITFTTCITLLLLLNLALSMFNEQAPPPTIDLRELANYGYASDDATYEGRASE